MVQELIPGAIYRFIRTSELRYYRAEQTPSGVDFLYPIGVGGSRIADRHKDGRRYVLLYLMTRWGRFATAGYWLDPRQAFKKAYVTDATLEDLMLVTHDVSDLAVQHEQLEDILNRDEVDLDMEVWGSLLEP